MQFTGHSLPVHQSMSVPWDFTGPISSANPAYAISSHNCHRNVSLPSGASLWNGIFGQVEGQYTTKDLRPFGGSSTHSSDESDSNQLSHSEKIIWQKPPAVERNTESLTDDDDEEEEEEEVHSNCFTNISSVHEHRGLPVPLPMSKRNKRPGPPCRICDQDIGSGV